MTAGLHPITSVDADELKHVGNFLVELAALAEQPASSAMRRVAIVLLEEALRQKRDLEHLAGELEGLGS